MTVSLCAPEDVPELVESAAALFAEDGGRRDPFMDTGWPDSRRSTPTTPAWSRIRRACASWPVAGTWSADCAAPNPLRPGAVTAVLESMRVGPAHRRTGIGAELVAAFFVLGRGKRRERDHRAGLRGQ